MPTEDSLDKSDRSPALSYATAIHSSAVEWYKSAESKAEILLTLDGVYLSFLVASIFEEPDDLQKIVGKFGYETWGCAVLMALAIALSIISALICLWSRPGPPGILKKALEELREGNVENANVLYYFGHLATLPAEFVAKYQDRIRSAEAKDEIDTYSSQALVLSKIVSKKHLWVNVGFASAGVSLVLLLLIGASYFARASAADSPQASPRAAIPPPSSAPGE